MKTTTQKLLPTRKLRNIFWSIAFLTSVAACAPDKAQISADGVLELSHVVSEIRADRKYVPEKPVFSMIAVDDNQADVANNDANNEGNVPAIEDPTEKLKRVWGDLKAEDFTIENLGEAIGRVKGGHVDPGQNGLYPYFNSFNMLTMNCAPAFVVLPTSLATQHKFQNTSALRVSNNILVQIQEDHREKVAALDLGLSLVPLDSIRAVMVEEEWNSTKQLEFKRVTADKFRDYPVGNANLVLATLSDYLNTQVPNLPASPYQEILIGQGFVSGFDPFSGIHTKEQEQIMRHGQSFVGIGTQLRTYKGDTLVTGTVENGGARSAGIDAGDIIVAVDGNSIKNLPINKVVKRIVGPEGTSVELSLRKIGQNETRIVNVERKKINPIPVQEINVGEQRSARTQKPIHYIKYLQFLQRSGEMLRQRTGELADDEPIILDLRGNPGGLVSAAVNAMDSFIKLSQPNNPLAYFQFRGGIIPEQAKEKAPQEGLNSASSPNPLVVLVDEGSASGSELLSSALKDAGRAFIIGKTTFGKGTMHLGDQIGESNYIVSFTRAYYFVHSDFTPQYNGVEPHISLDAHPEGELDTLGLRPMEAHILERDLPGALRAVQGRNAAQVYASEKLESVKSCVQDSSDRIDAGYAEMAKAPRGILPDRQFQAALAAIDCMEITGGI